MTQHTAGPWTIRNGNPTIIDGPHETAPHTYTLAETFGYKAQREANARLIAAAPDLLAALKAILDSEDGSTLLDGGSLLGAGLRDLAQDAIAQAEGRPSA